jgi:hypothetical protein
MQLQMRDPCRAILNYASDEYILLNIPHGLSYVRLWYTQTLLMKFSLKNYLEVPMKCGKYLSQSVQATISMI